MTDEQPSRRKKTARGRGEGSYSRLSDGRWVYQVSMGVGPDGKRQRPRFYGETKGEAREHADEYLRRLRRGEPVSRDRDRLETYLEGWLNGLIREPETLRVYRNVIKNHVIPRIGNVRLGELRQEHIRTWQRDMLDAGHSSNLTNHVRHILSSALRQAERDGYVTRNVVSLVQDVRHVQPRRKPFTAEQSLTFVERVRDTIYGPLYLAAIGLVLRKGELRGLCWSDIEGDVVHVQRQLQRVVGLGDVLRPLKTGTSGQRDLPLPAFVRQALTVQADRQRFDRERAGERWDTSTPDLVFKSPEGRPLGVGFIDGDFRRQLVAAGLPPIHFHDLRHSGATLLLSLGVEMRTVQIILGHSSMATTELYAHVLPSLMTDAMGRLDAHFKLSAQ